jgi:hypothetical protein
MTINFKVEYILHRIAGWHAACNMRNSTDRSLSLSDVCFIIGALKPEDLIALLEDKTNGAWTGVPVVPTKAQIKVAQGTYYQYDQEYGISDTDMEESIKAAIAFRPQIQEKHDDT